MSNKSELDERYTLWGGALSVYTAKIRSYLIKKRIPYRELYPSSPEFGEHIVPTLGFFVIPVLETPEGKIVQDTSDIIDYLEVRHPDPCFIPSSPLQSVVADLLCAYGSEGLNQPSMHYRWSFLDQHGDYIRAEFGRAISLSRDRRERSLAAEPLMGMMTSHLSKMGIHAETIPVIEASYLSLLSVLDNHFLFHPYLLGDLPSMADFGLMTGLYAHLSRDPVPSSLMKSRAPNVYRWTERMNLANLDDGEFPDSRDAYMEGDVLPETLEPVLDLVFRDWAPELSAATTCFNEWIDANPGMPVGQLVSDSKERMVHPALGQISYELRGATLKRDCAPQTLWHFHRVASAARELEGEALKCWHQLLNRTGGEQVMNLRLGRPIQRDNNVLVLG